MGIQITLENFERLDANLINLGGEAGERILRKAARAAGEVVQAAITEAAPVRTELRKSYGTKGNAAWSLPPGAVKSDIQLRVRKNDDIGGYTALVAPGTFTRAVCVWLEYGHENHRRGRKYKGGTYNGLVEAHPFIRPAAEASQAAAIAAAEGAIADELIKQLREMRAI